METIKSPLIPSSISKVVQTIKSKEIISRYGMLLKIDVRRFFSSQKIIQVMECQQSGYRFYFPLNTSGDGAFYNDLSKFNWYYLPWKWEHEITALLINSSMSVLEVGCANGTFLEKLKKNKNCKTKGLELNEKAVIIAKARGLDIQHQTIQEHAITHKESYDIVCSFQVLEHISQPYEFLKAKIDCLKVNGKLVICVPNNDSFIKDDPFNILNMPPHHMGLWNEKSLNHLSSIFPIRTIEIKKEPFQEYHKDYYVKIKLARKFGSTLIASIMIKTKLYRLFYYSSKIIKETRNIDGHSILMVFEKIAL